MADIYTHLRELGVAFSFFNKKSIHYITPEYFLDICKQYVNIPMNFDISMIANNKNCFSEREIETLSNALRLGNVIKEKFNISDKPQIIWVGCETQSDSPVDLIIDNYKFSLKEESYIIENMGLYKLLNVLLNSQKYSTGTHIFKEFANQEFEEWFNITCKCLIKDGPKEFKNSKPNKYNVSAKLNDKNIYMEYSEKEKVQFNNIDTLTYSNFEEKTNSHIREQIFSKWIKEFVENDDKYIQAKKNCAIVAGKNIIKLVKNCEGTSPVALQRFFRITDETYYYAKTTNRSLEIYKVPSAQEASKNILIKSVKIEVPKTQLNFYTEIINLKNNCKIIFRNELRYSHGQFNGTPEAKCYIDKNNNDLTTMYEKIV